MLHSSTQQSCQQQLLFHPSYLKQSPFESVLCPCISLYIHPSIYLSLYICMYSCMYLSIFLCIYTCMYLSIYPYIYLSMDVSIPLSMDVSIFLSIYLSMYLFVYLCTSSYIFKQDGVFYKYWGCIYLSYVTKRLLGLGLGFYIHSMFMIAFLQFLPTLCMCKTITPLRLIMLYYLSLSPFESLSLCMHIFILILGPILVLYSDQ